MNFKLSPIEIPDEDPFKNDALNRKAAIHTLTSLIGNLNGPFVLAIDSPWGTGKTTFIQMWQAHLKLNEYICIYFNSWESDFASDPLIVFLGEIENFVKASGLSTTEFNEVFEKTKKIATGVAKRALPVAGKILTAGLLEMDDFSEKALSELSSDLVKDAIDEYQALNHLNKKFHVSLTTAVEKLKASKGSKDKIIIFVDEIDRCRPTYAIELLERIKHLFNVPNVIFVLSLDKDQLNTSLSVVYGQEINADEYLRRFIDLEFSLPKANAAQFTRHLYRKFDFLSFFLNRQDGQHEEKDLVELFTELSDLFDLSLRAREQCFTRIRIGMMTTPSDYYFYPVLIVILVILKAVRPSIYQKFISSAGTASDVLNCIRGLPNGENYLFQEHSGALIESYLIAAKCDPRVANAELEHHQQIYVDQAIDFKIRQRSQKICNVVNSINQKHSGKLDRYVIDKIDLITQFN
ncbi:P-loop NTPase fold protein [Nitrosomonas sp. Is24]|uniref:KAP family P-loop NTPase fold protein n=1 Tax=Nitrosomonas sp. Is24 TaxID=3080533 RepID=UPI00294AE27E|nr:P-loop NTPase fold protein [Nitrosomonas sp. Is24]MDV6340786.1 P-loop NTPase fold protein [Nitrosomonas sp. Is24]